MWDTILTKGKNKKSHDHLNKSLYKIQPPFILKTLIRVDLEGKYLNIIKAIYDKCLLGGSNVRNLSALQETQVWSLGWEALEEDMATHSSILAWRIPWTKEPGESHGQKSLVGYSPWGRKDSDTTEQLTLSFHFPLWHTASHAGVCWKLWLHFL